MAENLVFSPTKGWMTGGCSCNAKPVALLPNTKQVTVKLFGKVTGPVSGIEYTFSAPHLVNIDIDTADADYWIAKGTATLAKPGQKGRTARA